MKSTSSLLGHIHSFETFGTLDGPGIRLVIFLHGCPLRCLYCHNVDMLYGKNYQNFTPQQLFEKIQDYLPYFQFSNGGITLSGGDPIFQPQFVLNFLKICKKNNIHTCLDTSLFTSKKIIDSLLPYVDLWMVSLKHFNNKKHLKLTNVPNDLILKNIQYLSDQKARLWLRYLILPGWTDTYFNLRRLISFLKKINFELIELLPYHTFGVYKWEKIKLKYHLKNIKPPSLRSVLKIRKKLEKNSFKVQLNEI